MIVVLGLLIVGAVLTLSAVVVLLSLASEAEVLPALRPDGGYGSDEPAASSRSGSSAGAPQQLRAS
jgi:hypothetical protein